MVEFWNMYLHHPVECEKQIGFSDGAQTLSMVKLQNSENGTEQIQSRSNYPQKNLFFQINSKDHGILFIKQIYLILIKSCLVLQSSIINFYHFLRLVQIMKRIWKVLFDELLYFLIRPNNTPPFIIFMQIAYITAFGSLAYSNAILVIAIAFSLTQRINYFWYVGILIQPGLQYFALLNMIVGLLSCNERWKLFVYLYIVLFFLTFEHRNLHYAYNVVALIALISETYFKLPFKILEDNRDYFIGFSCLFIHFGFNFFIKMIGWQWNQLWCELILLMIVFYVAYSLITKKIRLLRNSKFEEIDTPVKIYHYLNTIKERSKEPLEKIGMENVHKFTCRQPDCFCHSQNNLPFQRLFFRKVASLSIKKFDSYEFRESLQEIYISDLLEDNMFPLAVQNFLKQNNYKWDIFKGVKITRTKIALLNRLKFIQSSYIWKTAFQDSFAYQKNFQQLRRYILKLIGLKVQFWNQIIKKSTKAIKLKILGKQFLKKFNQMNQFYLQEIAPIQKQIRVYSGGILYNLFLLTATNYKQMAETNIKEIKKMNDPVERKTYKLSIIKVSLTSDRMGLIQNLNNNCVKMLGADNNKSEYIGKSIDDLVPQSYLHQHCVGMRRLRQNNSQRLIGAQLDTIFVVGKNKHIVASSIFYKFSPDILNQLSVIALLKHYKQDWEYILINGQASPQYTSSSKMDIEIVKTRQIQSIINQFWNLWKGVDEENPIYPLPEAVKIQMKYKDADYICIISSPLCRSFKYPRKPPIHLAIKNETNTYFHNQLIGQEADLGALKKIQVILDQNETQSQASSMSRRSSIIQVLKMFQQNSGVQLFRYYHIVMGIISIIAIIFITIQYNFTSLNWMRTENQSTNNIQLFSTHYQISYWISAFVNKGMSLYGIYKGAITNSGYSSSYGTSNYSSATLLEISTMCTKLAKLLEMKDAQDDGTGKDYNTIMESTIQMDTHNGPINLMFGNILNLAVVNCHQMAAGKDFWTLPIYEIYWKHVFPNYNILLTTFKNQIFSDLQFYTKLGYIIFFVLSAIIMTSIIPIYIGNRRVSRQQEYVFDLMTSISPDLIQQDILDLTDLQTNLKSSASSTFNYDDKDINIAMTKGMHQNDDEEKSEMKIGIVDQKRKRTGQLDTKGNNSPKMFLYLAILLFIGFLLAVFVIKIIHIESVKAKFTEIARLKNWRNLRLDQLINLKKYIYALRPQELIMQKTLYQWLNYTFQIRRGNYSFTDGKEQVPINCTLASAICKNGTVSELSVNVFVAQLLVETFVTKKTDYLGVIAVLKDISKDFNDEKSNKLIGQISDFTNYTRKTVDSIFIASLLYVFIVAIAVFFYIKYLKRGYVYLTRFITFLTEDMIKKNKRVQSYLQILMKSQ